MKLPEDRLRSVRAFLALIAISWVAIAADCMSSDLDYPFVRYVGTVVDSETGAGLDSVRFEVAFSDSLIARGISPELTEFHVTDTAGGFSFELRLRGEEPEVCRERGSLDVTFRLVDLRERVPGQFVTWPFCRNDRLIGTVEDLVVEM